MTIQSIYIGVPKRQAACKGAAALSSPALGSGNSFALQIGDTGSYLQAEIDKKVLDIRTSSRQLVGVASVQK